MRTAPAALLLVLALAGCTGGAPETTRSLDTLPPLDLTAPVVLTEATRGGFEPSIAVGPEGTVYVTAATTSRPGEVGGPDATDARLASWLWYSTDGATFHDLPSPAGAHTTLAGLEGDITVDGAGRLYFVDTYLADNTLSRWSPPAEPGAAPAWDFSRPVQGTASPVDDRPWLAAHGDGVVYLLSNNGADLPSPDRLAAGDATPGAKWLHRSTDGGMTWSLGRGFVGWCYPAADPTDDTELIVTCIDDGIRVHESHDQGRTWTTVFEADHELGPSVLVPGAAIDRAGTRHAAWLDDDSAFEGVQEFVWHGDTPGRVLVAHGSDGAWSDPVDVTPFEGRFGLLHSAAGGPGVHAVAFYATRDLEVTEDSEWTPHLLVSTDGESYRHVPLLDAPAGTGSLPPRDFFQVAVGPDDAVHAILQRDREGEGRPSDGIGADLLYVRQAPDEGL